MLFEGFTFVPKNVEMKQEGDMTFRCNILSLHMCKRQDGTGDLQKLKTTLSCGVISRGIFKLCLNGK